MKYKMPFFLDQIYLEQNLSQNQISIKANPNFISQRQFFLNVNKMFKI